MPKIHRDVHNLNNCRLLLAFSAAKRKKKKEKQTNKLLPRHSVLPDVFVHVTGESKF
jgi:hypothetical protein